MRISGPITVSALVVAGLMASGSTAYTPVRTSAPKSPDAQLAAATSATDPQSAPADQTAGLVPAAPEPPRKLRAMTTPTAPFAGTVPLRDIALPGGGALGIPEIVLAAYRNAELAMQSSAPGCGLSWHLLAGIGRIESGHARNGHTDAAGTTVGAIYGPALDGTLPGNEIIKASDGGYVRAVGPMQFLPGTWTHYSSDGNGDGVADPNNVFDATLAAAKYLCSGGLDLRDPQQELRSVLRYNNSLSYAANVLSWSNAYKTGGAPTQVNISPDLVPPGAMRAPTGPDMVAVNHTFPATPAPPPETAATTVQPPSQVQVRPQTQPQQTQVMINIPGLPPIPCGIFCPPPPPKPCDPATAIPAPMPEPMQPADQARQQWAPGMPAEAQAPVPGATPPDPNAPAGCVTPQTPPAQTPPALGQPNAPHPAPPAPEAAAPEQPQAENPALTPESAPAEQAAPAPQAAPVPPPAPGITLPFGIVIPLPAPAP